jgi:hypothetical protein
MPLGCGWNAIPKRAGSQMPKHVWPIQNSFELRSSGRSPRVST